MTLDLPDSGLSADQEIQSLAKQLDEAYRHTAAMLPFHLYLRSEQIKGKDRAYLIPLDKLHESPSLRKLKARKGASFVRSRPGRRLR